VLATAACLVGRDNDSADVWARAHHECLRRGDPVRAARCAFWLALGLLLKGELARGGGWLGRARRLLDDCQYDCAEQGYLLVPVGLQSLAMGDAATAYATFGQALKIGERFRDPDLVSLAELGRGQASIRLGDTAEGVALLDEVMVALTHWCAAQPDLVPTAGVRRPELPVRASRRGPPVSAVRGCFIPERRRRAVRPGRPAAPRRRCGHRSVLATRVRR
jgi:hypothetical protein